MNHQNHLKKHPKTEGFHLHDFAPLFSVLHSCNCLDSHHNRACRIIEHRSSSCFLHQLFSLTCGSLCALDSCYDCQPFEKTLKHLLVGNGNQWTFKATQLLAEERLESEQTACHIDSRMEFSSIEYDGKKCVVSRVWIQLRLVRNAGTWWKQTCPTLGCNACMS